MHKRWTWGAALALVLMLGASSNAKADGMEGLFGDIKMQNTETNLKITEQALLTYHVRNRAYPPALQALVDQNMIKALPVDGWDRPIRYTPPGDGPAELRSVGPDGLPGTGDDVVRELDGPTQAQE